MVKKRRGKESKGHQPTLVVYLFMPSVLGTLLLMFSALSEVDVTTLILR